MTKLEASPSQLFARLFPDIQDCTEEKVHIVTITIIILRERYHIIIKILSPSDCICRLSSTYLACRAPPRLAMRWRSWRDRFSYYSSSKYPSSKYSSSKYSSSKYPSSKNPSSKNLSSKYCGEVGGTGSRIIPPQNIPPQNIPPQNIPHQNIPHQNIPPQNIVEKLEEQFLILSLLNCSHITRQVLSYFVNCHI